MKEKGICIICGEPTPKKTTRYCGESCRKVGISNSLKERNKGVISDVKVVCKYCGKERIVPIRLSHKKYCSRSCYLKDAVKGERKLKRLLQKDSSEHTVIKKACAICGSEFKIFSYENDIKYCSEKCRWIGISKNVSKSLKKAYREGRRTEGIKGKHQSKEANKKRSDAFKKKFENGYVHPMKNKQQSKDSNEKRKQTMKQHYKEGYKPPMKGRYLTDEQCKKVSEGKIKSYNSPKGEETKRKLRIAKLKDLKDKIGFQPSPNYNKLACKFFKKFNRTFHLDGFHAENKGEYFLEELGFHVDYYDPKFNLVIEWDEEHHYKKGSLRKADEKRQKQIIDYLDCKLIRIRENDRSVSFHNSRSL